MTIHDGILPCNKPVYILRQVYGLLKQKLTTILNQHETN